MVAEMLRKVRPRGTRDTEFCFTEAPGICLLLAGGAGPVLVCGQRLTGQSCSLTDAPRHCCETNRDHNNKGK